MKKPVTRRSGTRRSATQAVPAYIASTPSEARPALRKLRREIRAAIPQSEEVISYGVPAYKADGRLVLGFGAARGHCSIYVMSPAVMRRFAGRLKTYEVTKGAIHFSPEKPFPVALLRALVKARLSENAGIRVKK